MLIVVILYLAALWLIFNKFKLVEWNWVSGSIAAVAGLVIVGIFIALLNSLTPSGRIVVAGRVVEVTPNVSGQVISVSAKPNVLIKSGEVLFEIDRAPYQIKVKQLEASLAEARQRAAQLEASYDQANAAVEGLSSQLEFNKQRLADIQALRSAQAGSIFKEQESQVQVDVITFQLQSAKAARINAKIARDAEVGGENPAVAQIMAQLDQARWDLRQTSVPAPSDGYLTSMTLAVGQRATALRSVMAFLPHDDVSIIGLFPPNGFGAIKPGADVTIVLFDRPGKTFKAKILEIPVGTGQGQIAVSGVLARSQSIGGTTEYPALISIPDGMRREDLRLGMPGMATVYAEEAGPIATIAAILIWIGSIGAYL